MDVMQKIKRIGALVGEKSVFRIGIDSRNGKVDLLSVEICDAEFKSAIAELPETDIPDYIG